MEYIKNSKTFRIMMVVCTLLLIFALAFLIAYLNTNINIFWTFFVIFIITFYHFIMRNMVGLICTKIFENKKFDYNAKWFQLSRAESKFYKLINIKQWKNKLPTAIPEQFDLTKRSMDELLFNMTIGEIIHEISMILSLLPMLLIIPLGSAWALIITSVLAFLIESLFVMLQRYNRPRVLKIKALIEKRKSSNTPIKI